MYFQVLLDKCKQANTVANTHRRPYGYHCAAARMPSTCVLITPFPSNSPATSHSTRSQQPLALVQVAWVLHPLDANKQP
eukprot:m.290158 g.290158  ORF g.290158 m.290158 type:complete len:79 (-) comp19462_c1_seq13:4024-4260(-)